MKEEFSPEIENREHHHAVVGMATIILALAVALTVLFGWGRSSADTGNPTINDSYILLRIYQLAAFKDDEKPTSPAIRYLMPGERVERGVSFGNTVKKVYFFDPTLGIGAIEAIFTAPKYEIKDASKSYSIMSFKRVVGDILKDGSVELAKEDIVEPPRDTELVAGNSIKIIRVKIAQIEENETLPYQTKQIDDPNLERGKQNVEQAGKTGKKTLTYSVRRENGQEVARSLIKSEIVSKPEDRIIKIGTKIIILSSVSGEASWTKGATAMRRYKMGVLVKVTNKHNGKSVEVRVGGWGPMEYTGRILDLEQSSFEKIADLNGGTTDVLVEEIKE